MIESTHGLIFRTRRFTETSLIVSWLTPAFGRLSTLAKGALRPKSPFRGKLDLYYEADFTFVRSRASELHTLREVSLRETHSVLRRDLGRLRQAAYGAALVEQLTERETPLPGVFELVRAFLSAVCEAAPQPQTVLAFELKLLDELGLRPELGESGLSAGSRRIAGVLTTGDWPAVTRLKLSPTQSVELWRFLEGFIIFHAERIPKGRKAALGLGA